MTFATSTLQAEPGPASAAPAARRTGSTYVEILGSTMLIGASSLASVLIGIARTKAMALLLGAAGFGLMGLYLSICDLAHSVAAMGIKGSAVRQIAESAATGDGGRIARTVTALRRCALGLGVAGAGALALLARPVSELTFGSDAHADAVALLSLVVLFRVGADGQEALVQGLRRIGDVARIAVIGPGFGALVAVPIVYHLREDGIVPALIAMAALSAATAWVIARRVGLPRTTASTAELVREAGSLLQLGGAFMVSGLLMMGAAFVVRLFVLREDGLGGAGQYQAAWTLGGLYVGFILQAMGTDFYPRLVGSIGDRPLANRLVNEQAQVSLLLAGPGVIATLVVADLVVPIFYSSEFAGAVTALRWICLGMALRVISWPLGYVIVARQHRLLFLAVELAWTVVNVGLSWVCVQRFGLTGAGMAFFGSYVFHAVMVYLIVRRLSGFRWSARNRRLGVLFVAGVGAVFLAFAVLPPPWALVVGMAALLASTLGSLRALTVLVPMDRLPASVRRLRSLWS